MSERAIVTIVTVRYLAYARALLHGCEMHEPSADRFVVVVDRPPEDVATEVQGAEIIRAEDLGIRAWRRYAFQYRPFELCCALKPHAIHHLLTERGYREVAYLDSDMALYGPLTPVWQALGEASIILTPHLTRPLPVSGALPYESLYTLSGTFNGGFVCVRDTCSGRAFVVWWREMLRKHCIVDHPAGIFVDQRWLCLVPGMFAGVKVLRHAGVNAGHWTMVQATWEQRPTGTAASSDVHVDGDPLLLFHFGAMTVQDPHAYRTLQNRIRVEDIPCLKRLVDAFHREVHAAGWEECNAWGCELERLCDGTPIQPAWREAIRRDEAPFGDVDDPFDVASHPDLLARFRAIEAHAHEWREEWRAAWERTQRTRERDRQVSQRARRLWRRIRAGVSRFESIILARWDGRLSNRVGGAGTAARAPGGPLPASGASPVSRPEKPAAILKFSQTSEPPETELCELFLKYGSDKCPQIFHSYSPEYHRILQEHKTTFSEVMEIGVGSRDLMAPIAGEKYVAGASLYAWRDFFPRAFVHGLDLNESVLFEAERIKCFRTDQSSREQLRRTIAAIRAFRGQKDLLFDLILDDGSHAVPHMLLSFATLFEYVKPNGVYIIEDIKRPEIGIFREMDLRGGEIIRIHEGSGPWDGFIAIRKNA
jgi:hypothetical protein